MGSATLKYLSIFKSTITVLPYDIPAIDTLHFESYSSILAWPGPLRWIEICSLIKEQSAQFPQNVIHRKACSVESCKIFMMCNNCGVFKICNRCSFHSWQYLELQHCWQQRATPIGYKLILSRHDLLYGALDSELHLTQIFSQGQCIKGEKWAHAWLK